MWGVSFFFLTTSTDSFKVNAKANVLKYQSLQHKALTVSAMALTSVLTHGAKVKFDTCIKMHIGSEHLEDFSRNLNTIPTETSATVQIQHGKFNHVHLWMIVPFCNRSPFLSQRINFQ